jgi:Protein of unknown function (DUF2786)/SprT-like family
MTPFAIEKRIMKELALEWQLINENLFKRRLSPPVLALRDGSHLLGQWVPSTRTIEISRNLVTTVPWTQTLEVLKHEMAHQFVHEVLGVEDETAHGVTFRKVCADRGIDSGAQGLPTGSATHPETGERAARNAVMDKIAKLLALAESQNQNEAEAAMVRAERLLAQYNIEHAELKKEYHYRHLGAVRGKVFEPDRILAGILTGHFFVDAIWISSFRPKDGVRGSVLEICGSLDNLDFAEFVHGFLQATAERLWVEHQRTSRTPGSRERLSFLAGVMTGFLEKLRAGKSKRSQEGLVWVGDAALGSYFQARHPRVRMVRYQGTRKGDAYAEGKSKGRGIVLAKPLTAGTKT